MRRLWHDIDQARDKLGLGGAPETASAPPWSIAALLGCATDLTTSATACIRDLPRAVPATVDAVLGVAPWLRRAPIIGRLIAWLPDPPARTAGPRER